MTQTPNLGGNRASYNGPMIVLIALAIAGLAFFSSLAAGLAIQYHFTPTQTDWELNARRSVAAMQEMRDRHESDQAVLRDQILAGGPITITHRGGSQTAYAMVEIVPTPTPTPTPTAPLAFGDTPTPTPTPTTIPED